MPVVFISYRREDSSGAAGRVYDRLRDAFGVDGVFIDVDHIPFGVDFREHLSEAVARCDVLLALIGPSWIDAHNGDTRRLDDPADFVRIEIAAALQRGIPVIPVLVGRTEMPHESELPEQLASLAYRNAATVDLGRDFHHHLDGLIANIEKTCPESRSNPPVTVPTDPPGPDVEYDGRGWVYFESAVGQFECQLPTEPEYEVLESGITHRFSASGENGLYVQIVFNDANDLGTAAEHAREQKEKFPDIVGEVAYEEAKCERVPGMRLCYRRLRNGIPVDVRMERYKRGDRLYQLMATYPGAGETVDRDEDFIWFFENFGFTGDPPGQKVPVADSAHRGTDTKPRPKGFRAVAFALSASLLGQALGLVSFLLVLGVTVGVVEVWDKVEVFANIWLYGLALVGALVVTIYVLGCIVMIASKIDSRIRSVPEAASADDMGLPGFIIMFGVSVLYAVLIWAIFLG